MSDTKHTEGRLTVEANGDGGDSILRADGGDLVAEVVAEDVFAEEAEANARRLAACWNACAGITTEALESGEVGRLKDELDRTTADLEAAIKHGAILIGFKLARDGFATSYGENRIEFVRGAGIYDAKGGPS